MNGVHDLGGTDGLGAVVREADEPVWHAPWEKAVFTMFFSGALGGYFNLDMFRSGIEKMHPVEYLSSTYYEHWLHSMENHLLAGGAIDAGELERRTQHYLEHPDEPLPAPTNPEVGDTMAGVVAAGLPAARETDASPAFAVGQRVRVLADAPFGHTRRARYVRGHHGLIDAVHPAYIFPDSAAEGLGEDPKIVYTVRFTAEELWGAGAAEPGVSVYFDVWEPYLTAEGNA